jgi:predicted DNA binding CopG/RHH family protein
VERRRFESLARGRQVGRNGRLMPDRAIDFSDIPESTEEELRKARRVGRPRCTDAKTLIAIRIRSSLLKKLRQAAKEQGKPYQTFIHEILEQRMTKVRRHS